MESMPAGLRKWHCGPSAVARKPIMAHLLLENSGSRFHEGFQVAVISVEVILWAVRWYCEYKVTSFDPEDVLYERDVDLDR
jgi:hypothetical protein